MIELILALALQITPDVAACEGVAHHRNITLNDPNQGTVLQVRVIYGDETKYYGYHESGVYPTTVDVHWCGAAIVEFRVGSECTVWNGEYMERVKTPDGRQKPCAWGAWTQIPQVILNAPNAPYIEIEI